MRELKALPRYFVILKKIGHYLTEYFQDSFSPRIARSTDIYEFLKHKADIRKEFPTPRDFGNFMKYMHLHHECSMKQFIAYKVVDTNPNYLQWFFYPLDHLMSRQSTEADRNRAETVVKDQLKSGRKIYPASNGEHVRSLQELHIYNMLLAERDFTVYYERPLIAGGEDRFPDFTVRNKQTDTVFFWEHFGLSEKGAYMDNMVEKIAWYQRIGINKIEDGGCFIATIFVNENHFVNLVDQMILEMKKIVVASGFLRHG